MYAIRSYYDFREEHTAPLREREVDLAGLVRARGRTFRWSGEYGDDLNSPAMLQMFETLKMVAPTDATVLITGESGTGKELIANALHQNSQRSSGP